ncbi:hypothetical protein LX36DRAFT_737394 [Colletotrichum falcatum]|nr:hypothetical protein LX36DRAFT_737394 [Colletotrichum falcatum]
MKSRFAAVSAASAMLTAAGAAAADDSWRAPGSAFGSPLPPFIDSQTAEVFRKAVAAPNATRSVKFRPFEDSGASNTQLEQDEWTWRVNVTELTLPRLPSNLSSAGINQPSTYVTTYDLAWPAGGNVSTALRGSSSPFCVTAFDYPFPTNVTGLYRADDDGADCGSVLGDDCLDALYYDGNNLDGDLCVVPRWGDIPECNATLGAAVKGAGQNSSSSSSGGGGGGGNPFYTYGLQTADANPASANNALNDAAPVLSGEGIWTFQGGVLAGADAVRGYEDASGRLRVFMFNTWLNITGGRVSKPNVLCMRVNAAAGSAPPAATPPVGGTSSPSSSTAAATDGTATAAPTGSSGSAAPSPPPRRRAAAVAAALFVTVVVLLFS